MSEQSKRANGIFGSTPPRIWTRAAVILALGCTMFACSLILSNESSTQCQTNADCVSLNVQIEGQQTVCRASDHTCVPPEGYCNGSTDTCPTCPGEGGTMVATCNNFTCGCAPSQPCLQDGDCSMFFDAATPAHCVGANVDGGSKGQCVQYPQGWCNGKYGSSNATTPCGAALPICDFTPSSTSVTNVCVACDNANDCCNGSTDPGGVQGDCLVNGAFKGFTCDNHVCNQLASGTCRTADQQKSIECSQATPFCVGGACKACVAANDCCSNPTPGSNGDCIVDGGAVSPMACVSNACEIFTAGDCRGPSGQVDPDCSNQAGTPYCENGKCVACRNTSDCPMKATDGGLVPQQCSMSTGSPAWSCLDLGPGQCRLAYPNDCMATPGKPFCIVSNTDPTYGGVCVACIKDSDCPMTGSDGGLVPSQCVSNSCVSVPAGSCRTSLGNADCVGQTTTTTQQDCTADGGSCQTTVSAPDCLLTNTTAGVDVNGTCVGCIHNSECSAQSIAAGGSGAAICIANSCQNLLSADCPTLIGSPQDYQQDNVQVFGAEFLISGTQAASGGAAMNGVVIARNHFLSAFGGLPGPSPGSAATPFIFVGCNEAVNPSSGATHLVHDLHVPFILGLQLSADEFYAAQQVTGPAGVVTITSANTGSLSTLNDGVSFTDSAPDTDFIASYQAVVTGLQAQLEAAGTVQPNHFKVAIFHRGDIVGTYLTPLIVQDLVFNGVTGAANLAASPPLLGSFDYGFDPGETTAQTAMTTSAAVASLIAFQPNIIIYVGTPEIVSDAIQIESGWPSGAPYFPTHLFYPAASSFAWATWGSGVATDPNNLAGRILGIGNEIPPSGDAVAAAVLAQADVEYNANIPDGAAPDGSFFASVPIASFNSGNAGRTEYDAAHLLLLGMVAAEKASGGAPVTGKDLSKALTTSFGPQGMQAAITSSAPPTDALTVLRNAVAVLQSGGPVEYYGTTGPIKFDSQLTFHLNTFIFCVAGNTTVATGIHYIPTSPGDPPTLLTGTCSGSCAPACSPYLSAGIFDAGGQ